MGLKACFQKRMADSIAPDFGDIASDNLRHAHNSAKEAIL